MKVILVEDDDNTATLTELYMEKMGFSDHIDRTYRIKPFEAMINTKKYDLALIDYHLQFFDAPEFVKLTKDSRLNSKTPIIVISHELSRDEEKEIEMLGVHYIRRPDDYMRLVDLIKNILRKMN